MSLLETIQKSRYPIYAGMDFNVSKMAAIAALHIDGKLYVFREYYDLYDTPMMIEAMLSDFPRNKIICFPDATGIKRGSADAGTSDIALLRKASFSIRARSRNPFIKDRVAAVNNAFNKKKLFIDVDRCPELTEALEQQIYATSGLPDKTAGLDHIVDALGYMVAYLMPVRELAPKSNTVVQ